MLLISCELLVGNKKAMGMEKNHEDILISLTTQGGVFLTARSLTFIGISSFSADFVDTNVLLVALTASSVLNRHYEIFLFVFHSIHKY